MRIGENCRFILLTLGFFCLVLGAAIILLALVGEMLFVIHGLGWFVVLAILLALSGGAMLLLFGHPILPRQPRKTRKAPADSHIPNHLNN